MDIIAKASALSRLVACCPDNLACNWVIGRVPPVTGEQPDLRFASQAAPMLAQSFEQFGAEHDVAVLTPLSALNVDHHALAVDVAHLQMRQLGSAHSGCVERHQDGAVERTRCSVDKPRNV